MTKTPEELTEDWKAGKLPAGWYYIKIEGFKGVDIDLYDKEGNSWLCNSDKDLNPLNVIAPVPSYDEYRAMQEQLNKEGVWYTKRSYKKLEKENNKLRGLLRECEAWMSWAYAELYEYDPEHESKNTEDLLTRINAELGCNKTQANPVADIKIQESEEK